MKTNNEKHTKRQLKANIEKLERYQREGRGDWWFYPLWKQILYIIIFPFVMLWYGLTWVIMIIGRGLFQLGDLMSGKRWNGGNWMEDV
jgi:hypothetical protein